MDGVVNEEELRQRFPNASEGFIAANCSDGKSLPGAGASESALVQAGDTGTAPKLERHSGDGALEEAQAKKPTGRRVLVRVTSFRTRLLDEDNLCEKYHVDLLRYAGILPSDAPGATKIEVAQKKVGKGEREFVRIEVF